MEKEKLSRALHSDITVLRENLKTNNDMLLKEISKLYEYYTTSCNDIWNEFNLIVKALKHQVQQLTASLKFSIENVKTDFMNQIKENNLCETKLDTLEQKLKDCDPSKSEVKVSINYDDIQLEIKALEEKITVNQVHDLKVVRVEYEQQFIDMCHQIPSMMVGNIYLTKNKQLVPLLIDDPTCSASCNEKQSLNKSCLPKLVVKSKMTIDDIDWISGITVTDINHIFLSDRWDMCVKEYNTHGKLLNTYDMPFEPWDIFSVSSSNIFVMLAYDFKLAVLEKQPKSDSFQFTKVIDTDKRYVSVCKVQSQILAVDRHTNVDILSPEGKVIRSLSIPALGEGMGWYPHRICTGIDKDTFLLLNWDIQHLLCYSLDGTLKFSHDLNWDGTNNNASTVGIDNHKRIYVCDKFRLYVLCPEGFVNILLTFEKPLEEDPRLFICNRQNLLYLSCYENGKKTFKMFQICEFYEKKN